LAKGIRVNQLAKELGVESKAILAMCREEGLGDKVPNHMSVLSIGLAETVREWATSGKLGAQHFDESAADTSDHAGGGVETAVKPKKTARKKKTDGSDDQHDDSVSHDTSTVVSDDLSHPQTGDQAAASPADDQPQSQPSIAATAPPQAPTARQPAPTNPKPIPFTPEPARSTGPKIISHVPHTPASSRPRFGQKISVPQAPQKNPPPAPVMRTAPAAPPAPPVTLPPAAPPEVITPAATAPAAPPKPTLHPATTPSRPTITLANRPGANQPPAPRKAVTPAPKLLIPEPAKISGPKIVREEKPEVLSPPRPPRRPPGNQGGQGGSGPNDIAAFTTARPQAGRGVRKTDDEEDVEAKKKAAKAKSLSSRRTQNDGRRGEADEKLKEFSDADLLERQERLAAAASYRTGVDSHLKKRAERGTHAQAKTGVQKGAPIEIEEPITVKSLSGVLGIKSNEIITKLMRQGVFATVNQTLDVTAAATIALDYGIELTIAQKQTLEEVLEKEFDVRKADTTANLVSRPPVVTILGHVDHGKTSLLDKIRSANVAAGEAGGITQHTAAWAVEVKGSDGKLKKVTFIDTPGHQAFTAMRARGANMTDVVVLVVAAVEGVMPQTVESINHAKAAGVPIVVALNKIDRPDANPDMVLGQLAANGLNPSEWGGDTEVIRTSAVTGQGIPELIEILDLQSQLLELKADPTVPARGSVIESRIDEGLGSVATALVQDGTLRVGDVLLSGKGYGRIRTLLNDRGESIQEAGPSTPVVISGLNELPNAGDKFYVTEDIDRARSIAEERSLQARQQQLGTKTAVTLDSIFGQMKAGDVKTINLIIKGDVQGSVETLTKTITEQNTEEVKVRVIHSAVGPISESDVELADASKAVIIGFHVVPDEGARQMAEQRRVEIRTYRVIYEIFDDMKKALSGMLEPEVREKLHGHAEIRAVYKFSKVGSIAGCFVTDGHIQRGSKIRLIRDGKIITEDLAIETLRRVKDDVKEVKAGLECGIKLAGYDDIKQGDRLEAYIRETIQRTL
jgi:translation initiation factor IF-2